MLKEEMVDYDAETGRMRSSPRQIFLELTPRCNLTCVQCPKDYGIVRETPDMDMSLETVDRVQPWLDQALAVNLNIVGEPLIARNFTEVLQRCARSQAYVSFNTNGLALTDRLCDQIVRSRVHSVVMSFDGVESNLPIRGVPYERVRGQLLKLDAARKRADSRRPHLGIAYTLMRRNLHELPRLIGDLLPRAHIEYIHVQPLMIFYETLRDQNIYHQSEVDDVIERSKEIADQHGCSLVLFRSTLQQDERNTALDSKPQLGPHSETLGCIDPFYEVKIRVDGTLHSCSYGLTNGFNVNEMELDEIWNHQWYLSLRKRLHSKRFEGKCQGCPYMFGSAANQEDPLRPGVHHSREERFLGGVFGRIPKELPPIHSHPFLPDGSSVPTRSLYEHG